MFCSSCGVGVDHLDTRCGWCHNKLPEYRVCKVCHNFYRTKETVCPHCKTTVKADKAELCPSDLLRKSIKLDPNIASSELSLNEFIKNNFSGLDSSLKDYSVFLVLASRFGCVQMLLNFKSQEKLLTEERLGKVLSLITNSTRVATDDARGAVYAWAYALELEVYKAESADEDINAYEELPDEGAVCLDYSDSAAGKSLSGITKIDDFLDAGSNAVRPYVPKLSVASLSELPADIELVVALPEQLPGALLDYKPNIVTGAGRRKGCFPYELPPISGFSCKDNNFIRGRNKEKDGKLPEAAECYRRSSSRECKYRLGQILFAENKISEARKLLVDVIKLGCKEANYELGRILEEGNSASGAVEHYLVAQKQGVTQASLGLGRLYEQSRQFNNAVSAFRKAGEGGEAEGWYRLGKLYHRLDKVEQAREAMDQACEAGSIDALLEASAWSFKKGLIRNAVTVLERAKYLGSSEASYQLGHVLLALGKPEQALPLFEEACRKQHCKAALWLGEHYYKNDDYEKAKEYYSQAAKQNDGHALFQLGSLAEAYEEFGEAKDYYIRAINCDYGKAAFSLGLLLYHNKIQKDEGSFFDATYCFSIAFKKYADKKAPFFLAEIFKSIDPAQARFWLSTALSLNKGVPLEPSVYMQETTVPEVVAPEVVVPEPKVAATKAADTLLNANLEEAERLMHLAKAEEQHGNTDEAERYYKNALQAGLVKDATYALGLLYLSCHRAEETENCITSLKMYGDSRASFLSNKYRDSFLRDRSQEQLRPLVRRSSDSTAAVPIPVEPKPVAVPTPSITSEKPTLPMENSSLAERLWKELRQQADSELSTAVMLGLALDTINEPKLALECLRGNYCLEQAGAERSSTFEECLRLSSELGVFSATEHLARRCLEHQKLKAAIDLLEVAQQQARTLQERREVLELMCDLAVAGALAAYQGPAAWREDATLLCRLGEALLKRGHEQEGEYWLECSSLLGYPLAYWQLGCLCQERRDMVRAKSFFLVASQGGCDKAKEALSRIL